MLLKKQVSIHSLKQLRQKEELYNDFPIGLITLEKDKDIQMTTNINDYQIIFSNRFANHLLDIPRNRDISIFKETLSSYKKWEINKLTNITLKDVIYNQNIGSYREVNNTFISTTSMIYVKIRFVSNKIFLCIDNYLDERKGIQENLAKSLNHQYMMTLYHELNNPLNALVNLTDGDNSNKMKYSQCRNDENDFNEEDLIENKKRLEQMKLLINLIQIFIENFIWFFKVMTEANKYLDKALHNDKEKDNDKGSIEKNSSTILNVNLNLEFSFIKTSKKFEILFNYKNITHETDYSFLNDKIIKSNEDYFQHFLRAIFVYLYHSIPRDGGFKVKSTKIPKQMIKITFINHKDKIINIHNHFKAQLDEIDFGYKEEYNVGKTVQTLDMTKELLIRFAEMLEVKIRLYDPRGWNSNKNTQTDPEGDNDEKYLTVILPYKDEENEDVFNEVTEEMSPVQRMCCLNAVNRQIQLESQLREGRRTLSPTRSMHSNLKSTTSASVSCYSTMKNEKVSAQRIQFDLKPATTLIPKKNRRLSVMNNTTVISNVANGTMNMNNGTIIRKIGSTIIDSDPFIQLTKIHYNTNNNNDSYVTSDTDSEEEEGRASTSNAPNNNNNNKIDKDGDMFDEKDEEYDIDNDNDNIKEIDDNAIQEIHGIGLKNYHKMFTENNNSNSNQTNNVSQLKKQHTVLINNHHHTINYQSPHKPHCTCKCNEVNYFRHSSPFKKSSSHYDSPTFNKNNKEINHQLLVDPKRKETFEFCIKPKTQAHLGLCSCSDFLIVDDEHFNISAIKFLLKGHNITVDTCNNGEECINKIIAKNKIKCTCSKSVYKIILLDIMMPVMDGLATAKKIQEMIGNGEIENDLMIIVISAHIDESLKDNLAKYPVVKGFISKPVKGNKLRKVIEDYYLGT